MLQFPRAQFRCRGNKESGEVTSKADVRLLFTSPDDPIAGSPDSSLNGKRQNWLVLAFIFWSLFSGPKISIETVEHSPKCLHDLSLPYIAIGKPNYNLPQVADSGQIRDRHSSCSKISGCKCLHMFPRHSSTMTG